MEEIENKCVALEEENRALSTRITQLEKKDRKNNIVFFGLNESGPPLETALSVIRENLKIDLRAHDINDAFRLGKRESGRNRPLMVALVNYLFEETIVAGAT